MPYQLIYGDYKDLATGKTLVVTPGSAYTIAVSSGRNAGTPTYPNDGRWTSVTGFLSASVEIPSQDTPSSDTLNIADPAPAPASAGTDKPKEGLNARS